jgi:hypothetical protein
MSTTVQATRVDTTLGSTREGLRVLAAWWGELAVDYQRHGQAFSAGNAAANAAHFGHMVQENGGPEC